MKISGKYMYDLMDAISKVANGDFSTRLDNDTAGPVVELYDNFNKMTAELEGVQTLRDDFINHFSHEFKTPITSINGFASLLMEEDLSEDEKKKYLEIIAAESDRLAKLSDSALLLTKLESQHLVPVSESFQLDEQIKQCIIILMPQFNKKNIDLSVNLEPVRIFGSADLIKHIWLNLLGNAVKYTEAGGKVKVELKEEESTAVAAISDNGAGMGKEAVTRAFEKYYQDESREKQKGLGLGLTIVKKAADLCGGRVEITSSPGKGSRFTVFLPVA